LFCRNFDATVITVVIIVTWHVNRLPSDTRDVNQRTTRSQTRTTTDKQQDTSTKTSKSTRTRAGAERSTLLQKASSMKSDSSSRGRSRFLSTRCDTAAGEVKGAKRSRNVVSAGSTSSTVTPRVVDGRNATKSKSATRGTTDSTAVTSGAGVVDTEVFYSETKQQRRRSQSLVTVLESGSQYQKNIENSGKNEDETGNSISNEDAVDSGHLAIVISSQADDGIPPSSTNDVDMHDANTLPDTVAEKISHSADDIDSCEPEVAESFRTPGRLRRACSMVSSNVTFASIRKTPKNLRNSLLLRRMSPEEGYIRAVI